MGVNFGRRIRRARFLDRPRVPITTRVGFEVSVYENLGNERTDSKRFRTHVIRRASVHRDRSNFRADNETSDARKNHGVRFVATSFETGLALARDKCQICNEPSFGSTERYPVAVEESRNNGLARDIFTIRRN